jgi:hypothetical protein
MKTIKQILIERDGMTSTEAEEFIDAAKNAMNIYLMDGSEEAAENICEEFFGLEPDYLDELVSE